MPWWGWIVVGSILFGAELLFVEADFYLVFLGVAAGLVGFIALLVPMELWVQWVLFTGTAILALAFLRQRIYRFVRHSVPGVVSEFLGETLSIPQDLPVGEVCRVEFKGTSWSARNQGSHLIPAGAKARILAVDGIVLVVESAD